MCVFFDLAALALLPSGDLRVDEESMTERLGSLLVRDRVVDVWTIEQAFRRIDSDGGRLGTNLLELGAIDEPTLTFYLSEVRGIPAPPDGMLANISIEAKQALDIETVLRFGGIPAAVESGKLAVLVRDPLESSALDVLSEKAGLSVRQYLLPDFRFEHVLAEIYELAPSHRVRTLVAQFPAEIGHAELRGGLDRITGAYPKVTGDFDVVGDPSVAPPLGTGWTTDHLTRFLTHCTDRDEIIHAVLGYAGNHMPRRYILAVQKGKFRGFALQGPSLSLKALKKVTIDSKRVLKRAKSAGPSAIVGLPADLGLTKLYNETKLSRPPEMACLLIHIGSRPVLMLVVDNDKKPVSRSALPDLEHCASEAGSALWRLVQAKKHQNDDAVDGDGLSDFDAGWTLPASVLAEAQEMLQPVDQNDENSESDVSAPTAAFEAVTTAIPAVANPPEPGPDNETTAVDDDVVASDPTIPGTPSALAAVPDDADQTPGEQADALMAGEIERFVSEQEGDLTPIKSAESALDSQDTVKMEAISPAEVAAYAETQPTQPVLSEGEPPRATIQGFAAIKRPTPESDTQATTQMATEPSELDYPSADALVDALLSTDNLDMRDRARRALARAGDDVFDRVRERFPGPVIISAGRTGVPSPSESGLLLAAIVDLGVRFASHLWLLMNAKDRTKRYYAVLCGMELRHPDMVTALTERLFDSDQGIRRLAAQVLRTYADSHLYPPALQRIRKALQRDDGRAQAQAAAALGFLIDREAVDHLIEALAIRNPEIGSACQEALERILFQSYARDKRKWTKWWNKNKMWTREHWLVDAVTNKSPRVRALVVEALDKLEDVDLTIPERAGRRDLKRFQAALSAHFKL